MRHGNKIKKLSRKKAHRSALLSNLASQLIIHKKIITTLTKAKALRVYIEPLITKTKNNISKEAIMHEHRVVFSYLKNKEAVKELFTNIAPKIFNRPGGYLRILKLGTRVGDNAEKAWIELVDFNSIYNNKKQTESSKKSTRRGRGTNKAKLNTETITEIEVENTEAPPSAEENSKENN